MTPAQAAFKAFRHRLTRYIAKRLSDPEDVQDVLGDVFLRVVRHQDALENAREPLAWLHTVTKSAIVDFYRKSARGEKANTVAMEPADEPAETVEGLERCLVPLVNALPEIYGEAVRFSDLEGGKQVDFARQKGLNPATVKSRTQRGRKMLKSSILACCRVELDEAQNVAALAPKNACC